MFVVVKYIILFQLIFINVQNNSSFNLYTVFNHYFLLHFFNVLSFQFIFFENSLLYF